MHHILRKNYRKGCHYRLSIKTIKFQEINWKNYDNYESSYKTVKRSAYGYQTDETLNTSVNFQASNKSDES